MTKNLLFQFEFTPSCHFKVKTPVLELRARSSVGEGGDEQLMFRRETLSQRPRCDVTIRTRMNLSELFGNLLIVAKIAAPGVDALLILAGRLIHRQVP